MQQLLQFHCTTAIEIKVKIDKVIKSKKTCKMLQKSIEKFQSLHFCLNSISEVNFSLDVRVLGCSITKGV